MTCYDRRSFRNDLLTDGDPAVYYACYGSNLLGSSFMDYMNVGRGWGEKFTSDKFESYKVTLPHNIYFADINEGYGAAFLDVDAPGECVGRIWKISRRQFTSLALLESRFPQYRDLDWNQIISHRDTIIDPESTYGRVTNLGAVDDLPVLTVTAPHSYADGKGKGLLMAPDKEYSTIISWGKAETHGCVPKDIRNVLSSTC